MASKASGIHLVSKDLPIVFGMQKRGDRDHGMAAWFGICDSVVSHCQPNLSALISRRLNPKRRSPALSHGRGLAPPY